MSEQMTMTPGLSHEEKLYFRAAFKECQAFNEHMTITEVVNNRTQCFNCQI